MSEAAVATGLVPLATAKLTISIKRKLGNGDEIFLAPGVEMHCEADQLDETQAAVSARVKAWVEELVADFPDPTDDADDSGDDAGDDSGEDGDDDGDLTAEDIDAMDLKELRALIKENGLDVPNAAKIKKVDELREAVKEAAGLNDDDADGEDGDDDDGSDTYTAEELKAASLEELQEIVSSWELDEPTIKKGADLKTKKAAYIKHILEAQEAAEEE